LINIKRRKKKRKKEGSDFERKRVAGEKGKEEEDEKKGEKDKGRRREVEEISLKGKIYGLKCISVFSFALIFSLVGDYEWVLKIYFGFD